MVDMNNIISLAKRRGFIFPSSEVYGGLSSLCDYGPLGIELKENIKNMWWDYMVYNNENIVGLDSSILTHSKVWQASGHVDNFSDALVDCKNCKNRFRADTIDLKLACPVCGVKDSFTAPRQFNLMFSTHLGAREDTASLVYMRPETAQGIFINFKNILDSTRLKIPFGVAQVGKAFRNEIVTKNFIFRTCEFEQMEMQFFCHPEEADKYFLYWKEMRMQFYLNKLKIRRENLRFKDHPSDELAHYAHSASDIEYKFPFGFNEVEGIHNRTDYDLKRHSDFSLKPKNFEYLDNFTSNKYIPYIIETSAGLTRMLLMVLLDSYEEEKVDDGERAVLKLHPLLSPYTFALFPLVKKDNLPQKARSILDPLRSEFKSYYYDESGTIGKRYRRQDEIGTAFCITVDYTTIDDNTVTVRERDSMKQERVNMSHLVQYLKDKVKNYKRE